MRVVCRHRIPVHPHCPCVWSTEAGLLPEQTAAHVQYRVGQMIPVHLPCSCTQYTSKENHNKPTLFFFLFLPAEVDFFLLSLHQNLDNSTSWKDWRNIQVFYCICAKIILTKERSSLPFYKIHGTQCVEMCQFGQMNFSKVSAFQTVLPSLPALFLICCPSVIYIILRHYIWVEAHPMGTIKHTVKLRKKS